MQFVKLLATGAVVVCALTACSSSSPKGSTTYGDSNTATTIKPLTAAEFCDQVKNEADAFDLSGITRRSADDLKRTYKDGADKLDELATNAPAAIQADMRNFVDLAKQLRAQLADVDYDASQLSLSALPGLTSPSTLAGLARISTYLRENCHIVEAQG